MLRLNVLNRERETREAANQLMTLRVFATDSLDDQLGGTSIEHAEAMLFICGLNR
jgi:hypothetical protein